MMPSAVPGRVVAAVDHATAADAYIVRVGHRHDRMQHRAAGEVQRLAVLQGDGVHGPLAGADIIDVGIVRVRHVRLRRIGEDVHGLVDAAVEHHRVGAGLGDRKADAPVLHLRDDAPCGGQHGGAVLVVDHDVVDEQLVPVGADDGRLRARHGAGPLVDGQKRLPLARAGRGMARRAGDKEQAQRRGQQQHSQDSQTDQLCGESRFSVHAFDPPCFFVSFSVKLD